MKRMRITFYFSCFKIRVSATIFTNTGLMYDHVRGCYVHMRVQALLPVGGYEIDRGYFGRACVARRRRYSTMTARNASGNI